MSKKAIIIGAGPAGLTAAYELLKRTDIKPIILEKSGDIGGISKTINYKGNRMDMGPHRFFSKSDRVMNWWLNIMPLDKPADEAITINYQNKEHQIHATSLNNSESKNDKVMLVIQRLTRIYFLRKFFAYPIQLSLRTLRTLGLIRTIKIMISFLLARLFPRKPEKSLEDFIINKFGKQLYLLFFKDYTEKVWGVPCHEISAEWGAQRIKGVSLGKAIGEAIKSLKKKKEGDISQKEKETSLIEQFLYPKYGPGSLWEEVARQVEEMGGKIYLHQNVSNIYFEDGKIVGVNTINSETNQTGAWEGNYFFSSMPVQELIAGMDAGAPSLVPQDVKDVAAGLQYRDFINVGVLLKQLSKPVGKGGYEKLELKDNWIYIQERDVKVGRLMIYNNWGEGMVNNPTNTWIGMEYFCNKSDDFWALPDEAIQKIAIQELEKMKLAHAGDVLDITVRRLEKTYPAYFGTYHQFDKIREYVNQFENLFLVGRNGMHKYNNTDHSMLTAMVAVDNIVEGATSKENLWNINTEQEYHEVKKEEMAAQVRPESASQPLPQLDLSFKHFIFRQQRLWFWSAIVLFLVQFVLFKLYYVYANYMPDSYSYLAAATVNADLNTWPVAYSKFLRIFSSFAHSDYLLTGFQYIFLSLSGLSFVFTLLYFFRPGKSVKYILLVFITINPVALYVANYISADTLFIGFSLLWLTQLIWIIYRPKTWMIFTQAILLMVLFTLRYNAIYYPLVTGLAFILSRQKWTLKLAGMSAGFALIAWSVLFTSNKMQTETGHKQFSPFGGWQLANNALYMYEQIPANERKPVPARFEKLEKMVRQHMDTLSKVKLTKLDSLNSYFYLWSDRGPLIQYMTQEWKKDTSAPYFKRWASVAPLYSDYAQLLMRNYPTQFIKAFIFPNLEKFFVPPPEFLETYNMGSDSVGKLAKEWFNYKSQEIIKHNAIKYSKPKPTQIYPIFSALVNVLLLICLAGMFVFNGFNKNNNDISKTLILILFLWILNITFSVFASPIVLRYQLFPLIMSFGLSIILIENIYKFISLENAKERTQNSLRNSPAYVN
ncbi:MULTISPECIES: NAD(P)/FAD-dependent oxidoreductase [Niastella]|uniref:FAD-dependent oxidoreductase n=1 Tax=Niastella soli TaxID=2821487 RepID=A0ABS3YY14_9BACT|nr:NAD(P)/FAD-dependent oxidoreductase [Niastella soli]MBO9202820.1 FAD-dependent oxidoreductase [Niastella soli]